MTTTTRRTITADDIAQLTPDELAVVLEQIAALVAQITDLSDRLDVIEELRGVSGERAAAAEERWRMLDEIRDTMTEKGIDVPPPAPHVAAERAESARQHCTA